MIHESPAAAPDASQKPIDGPWIVDEVTTPNGVAYEINYLWTDEDGETRTDNIAEVVMDYRGDASRRHADLLAAAPELLAKLKAILAEDDRMIATENCVTNISELIQSARDVVRKADGLSTSTAASS